MHERMKCSQCGTAFEIGQEIIVCLPEETPAGSGLLCKDCAGGGFVSVVDGEDSWTSEEGCHRTVDGWVEHWTKELS